MNAVRTVGAIVAGMVVAIILLVAVEAFSAVVHPFPPGFSGTMEAMCEHVARYPQWVLAVVVPAWAFTAFASTWTAGRIGNPVSAIIIGILLLAGAVCNVLKLPYPSWFFAAILFVIPIAIIVGGRQSLRRRTA